MQISQGKQVESFLNHLKFQRGYSPHTITAYEIDLSVFSAFLSLSFDETIELAKPIYIRSWLASLKENGISSKTINRKISSLRSFYKFLLKTGMISSSPMATVITPKISKRLPQFVNEKGTEELFNTVIFSDGLQGITEKLVLEILYNTGIRRSELVNLKESQIDFANSNIKVLGKGKKERIIPVSNRVILSLKNYRAEKKRVIPYTGNEFLFVNEKGNQITPEKVYQIVKKYLQQVTTISKKSPHILRHTFATQLMNNGADIFAVKELLGHSSLAATQVYTHNTIEKLKEVYKKAHPKA